MRYRWSLKVFCEPVGRKLWRGGRDGLQIGRALEKFRGGGWVRLVILIDDKKHCDGLRNLRDEPEWMVFGQCDLAFFRRHRGGGAGIGTGKFDPGGRGFVW